MIAHANVTDGKAIPFPHAPKLNSRRTTRRSRQARPVHLALPRISPSVSAALDRYRNGVSASEPISEMRLTHFCDPDESRLRLSDGRRRTSDARDYDDVSLASGAPTILALDDAHASDATAARRMTDASTTPTLRDQIAEWPVKLLMACKSGIAPQTMPYATRQVDPSQEEAAFLARVFVKDVIVQTAAMTAAALDGAPDWLTAAVLDEILCDGARPEAVARRLGITGKTVRKHVTRAGERLAAFDATNKAGKQPKTTNCGPPSMAYNSTICLDCGPSDQYRQAKIAAMLHEQAEILSLRECV
jgi:hypothetical protein